MEKAEREGWEKGGEGVVGRMGKEELEKNRRRPRRIEIKQEGERGEEKQCDSKRDTNGR